MRSYLQGDEHSGDEESDDVVSGFADLVNDDLWTLETLNMR